MAFCAIWRPSSRVSEREVKGCQTLIVWSMKERVGTRFTTAEDRTVNPVGSIPWPSASESHRWRVTERTECLGGAPVAGVTTPSCYDASSSSEIVNWWLLPALTINRRLRSLTSSHVTDRSKNPCRRPSLTSCTILLRARSSSPLSGRFISTYPTFSRSWASRV